MVKIKNIKNGVIKEVADNIASDFIGTKEWELLVENKEKTNINAREINEIKNRT